MLLLDRQGAKADCYVRIESVEEAGRNEVLAPFALIDAVLAAGAGHRVGASVENTQKAETLTPYFDRLALIVIAFPAGTNGRGFSLARQLRERGYRGVLRASGPLFPDQFPQALACGFDEIELPEASAARQPVEQWAAAAQRMSVAYQRGYAYGSVTNILEQRRAARNAGAK